MIRWIGWWRHVLVAGLVLGLLLSSFVDAPSGWMPCLLAAALATALIGRPLLAAADFSRAPGAAAWLLSLLLLGAVAGLGAGDARIAAIDAQAFRAPPAAAARAGGWITSVPRRSFGEVRFPLDTPDGTLLVAAREPLGPLPVGSGAVVAGTLRRPADPFATGEARRLGAAMILEARSVRLTGASRGGIAGVLDRIRGRAEAALAEGAGEEQAALARGFVLGQDDLIDPRTREEFQRSGLAHLLAVSGQNVMLLAILAGVVLGAFGVRVRARLLLTILLIAVYVPVAGAGPSIQRAGVMGAAGIAATLAGRPADRAYPPLLAAAATLLIDPRSASDVGWQLSFAAVVGITLWAAPLRDLIRERALRRLPARLAGPLAEGIALTVAATAATAPLMAHHFEALSLASLPANVLVLPAVAPVMWLGMLIGTAGQLPALPTGPLGAIEGALVDYVALVARVLAEPGWAQAELPLPSAAGVLAAYAALLLLAFAALAPGRRRRGLLAPRELALALPILALAGLGTALAGPSSPAGPRTPGTLRITALDVGQGDAILLEPPRGDPILVDGGPPGGQAAEALGERGIERLRAAFLTHDQLDHAGGLFDVFASARVAALIQAGPARELAAAARASGARVLRTVEGGSFRFGRLEIDVLWPPRGEEPLPGEDPNATSLVLAARFAGYDVLLSGDAEQELTRLDPGPLDVLKVAHHGSDDAGLPSMLARSVPRVALIGVGENNTYGHPTEETLAALAERSVCVLRTDLDGAATVELGAGGLSAWSESGPPPAARPGCAAS